MAARGATAVDHSAASDGRFNLKDKGGQHPDDSEVGSVTAGLARLVPVSAQRPSVTVTHPLGSAAAAGRSVATVENTTPTPIGTDRTGVSSRLAGNTAGSGKGP
jgi:hypothetical protein